MQNLNNLTKILNSSRFIGCTICKPLSFATRGGVFHSSLKGSTVANLFASTRRYPIYSWKLLDHNTINKDILNNQNLQLKKPKSEVSVFDRNDLYCCKSKTEKTGSYFPAFLSSVAPQKKQFKESNDLKSNGRPSQRAIVSNNHDGKEVLKSLFPYVWPESRVDRRRIMFSLACLVAAKLSTIQAPLLLAKIVNFFSLTPGVLPVGIIAGYASARVAASVFDELRNFLFCRVSQAACRAIACNSFEHIHRMDLNYILTSKAGELAIIISRGMRSVTQLLNMMLFQVIPTILEFSLVLVILSSKLGLPIAGITGLTMLMYSIFTAKVTSRRTEFRKDMNYAEQKANGVLLDSLINCEAVRHFTTEDFEAARYEGHQRAYERSSVKVHRSLAFLNAGQQLIFNSGLVSVMLFTSSRVTAGVVPIGHIVLATSLLFQLAIPLNFFGTVYRETRLNLVDMQKLHQFLNIEPSCVSLPDAPEFVFKSGNIQFENVHFDYPLATSKTKSAISGFAAKFNPGEDARKKQYASILRGINIFICGGRKVAFVGPSGGGKSTLIKLISRLFDPDKGNVYIDGQNPKDLNLHSYRSQIGVVPQDVVLFNDTILHNLRYGKPDASFDEVVKAAKLAELHGRIMNFPLCYDTVVGERGLKLSGGEKQRMGIARCILRNPKIYLFDEATSSLDMLTELRIMKNLKEVLQGQTCLIVAHRLATIADVDYIYYIDDGIVQEEGSFEELLNISNGKFKKMWQNQSSEMASSSTHPMLVEDETPVLM